MPEFHQLQETYRLMTDEEILRLAAAPEDMTSEANQIIAEELARRRLTDSEVAPYRQDRQKTLADRNKPNSPTSSRILRVLLGGIGYYIYQVFRDIARGKR